MLKSLQFKRYIDKDVNDSYSVLGPIYICYLEAWTHCFEILHLIARKLFRTFLCTHYPQQTTRAIQPLEEKRLIDGQNNNTQIS